MSLSVEEFKAILHEQQDEVAALNEKRPPDWNATGVEHE